MRNVTLHHFTNSGCLLRVFPEKTDLVLVLECSVICCVIAFVMSCSLEIAFILLNVNCGCSSSSDVMLPSAGANLNCASQRSLVRFCRVFNTQSNLMLLQPASSEEQKKIHKAMSSGDLGKVDSLRKNSQDGRFVLPELFFSLCLFVNDSFVA